MTLSRSSIWYVSGLPTLGALLKAAHTICAIHVATQGRYCNRAKVTTIGGKFGTSI